VLIEFDPDTLNSEEINDTQN